MSEKNMVRSIVGPNIPFSVSSAWIDLKIFYISHQADFPNYAPFVPGAVSPIREVGDLRWPAPGKLWSGYLPTSWLGTVTAGEAAIPPARIRVQVWRRRIISPDQPSGPISVPAFNNVWLLLLSTIYIPAETEQSVAAHCCCCSLPRLYCLFVLSLSTTPLSGEPQRRSSTAIMQWRTSQNLCWQWPPLPGAGRVESVRQTAAETLATHPLVIMTCILMLAPPPPPPPAWPWPLTALAPIVQPAIVQ